jgi:hypothetical protein
MTMLLIAIVAMIPLAWVLSSALPEQGDQAKRDWLRWAMAYLLLLLGLIVALVILTLHEIRAIMQRYYESRRDALHDTIEQIREDYHRRRHSIEDNGSKRN